MSFATILGTVILSTKAHQCANYTNLSFVKKKSANWMESSFLCCGLDMKDFEEIFFIHVDLQSSDGNIIY